MGLSLAGGSLRPPSWGANIGVWHSMLARSSASLQARQLSRGLLLTDGYFSPHESPAPTPPPRSPARTMDVRCAPLAASRGRRPEDAARDHRWQGGRDARYLGRGARSGFVRAANAT